MGEEKNRKELLNRAGQEVLRAACATDAQTTIRPAANKAADMSAGIRMAEEAIDSGAATGKLEALAVFTKENG